jgi:hypothetical protein
MKTTFAEIRNAYFAIRVIDGAPGGQPQGMGLLKDNLVAKSRSYRLQSMLRPEVDASEDLLNDLREQIGEVPGGEAVYARRANVLMRTEVEVPDHVVLTSRLLGDEVLKKVPSALLVDLGPFFVWEEE